MQIKVFTFCCGVEELGGITNASEDDLKLLVYKGWTWGKFEWDAYCYKWSKKDSAVGTYPYMGNYRSPDAAFKDGVGLSSVGGVLYSGRMVVFTDAFRPANLNTTRYRSRMGNRLAELIKEADAGELTEIGPWHNSSSGNKIKMWAWKYKKPKEDITKYVAPKEQEPTKRSVYKRIGGF